MSVVSLMSRLADRSPRQLYHYLLRRLLKRGRLTQFDDRHRCVFVLSTGRTGTNTLAALLGLVDNVFAYHEPKPLLYGLSNLSYRYSDIRSREILKESFLIARSDILNYSLNCGRGYVETSPQVTFLAPVILELIPGVRFIHLVRDPRDVVRSGMRRHWYAGNPYDKTRIRPTEDSEADRLWNNYSPFQKNLWLWTETNRWILDFTGGLADRVILVHSENVFNADDSVMEQLYDFVGASLPSKRRIKRILAKRLNAQKEGTFPKYSDWPDTMHHEAFAVAGEIAARLGYNL